MKLHKESKSFWLVLSIAIFIILVSLYSMFSPMLVTYHGQQDIIIYVKPKVTSAILGVIKEGSQVKAYEMKGRWIKVVYKNNTGYILNQSNIVQE